MPFNGSGGFEALTAPTYPAVAGDVIYASRFNAIVEDLMAGLSACLTRSGVSNPSANQPMNNFKHTGAAAGTAAGQYLVYAQGSASLTSPLVLTGANGTSRFSVTNGTDADFVIDLSSTVTTIGPTAAAALVFKTSNTARGRFTAGGEFCVGGTGLGGANILDVVGSQMALRATGGNHALLELAGNANTVASGSVAVGQLSDNTALLSNRGNAALNLATNNTIRLTVDATGRVLRPFQPTFSAHTSDLKTAAAVAECTTYTETSDVGANFNPTTGRFTAPITGVYFFAFTLAAGTTPGGTVNAALRIGGGAASVPAPVASISGDTSSAVGVSLILALTAAQYVSVFIDITGAGNSGRVSNFSGFLL